MADIIAKVKVELAESRVLHSGGMSKIFYDCDLLSEAELHDICYQMVYEGPQSAVWRVESVFSIGGGLRFADTLAQWGAWRCGVSQHTLVVDDVTTTGKSLQDLIDLVHWSGGKVVLASVIIQRGEAPELGVPFFSLFQVDLDIEQLKQEVANG